LLARSHRSADDEDAVCETKEEAPEETSNLPRRKISNNYNNLNSTEMKKGVIISQEEGRSRRFWAREGRGRGRGEREREREREVWVCAFPVCGALSALATLQGCLLRPPFLPARSHTRRVSCPFSFYYTILPNNSCHPAKFGFSTHAHSTSTTAIMCVGGRGN
jgi:hypothetical protein